MSSSNSNTDLIILLLIIFAPAVFFTGLWILLFGVIAITAIGFCTIGLENITDRILNYAQAFGPKAEMAAGLGIIFAGILVVAYIASLLDQAGLL